MLRRLPKSPTFGPSRVTSRRAIQTGNCSPLKPGNNCMPVMNSRSLIKFCFGFCLIAAANAPVLAGGGLNLRNAQVEPLSFTTLDGWKDDDHAAAFAAFLKSCGAILNASKTTRSARPFLGGLFKVCERAAAA